VLSEYRIYALSLFIPRVFPNITEDRIKNVFVARNLGQVDHVDFVAKVDKFGNKYNSAYVHFNGKWFSNDESIAFREQICFRPETQTRLIYDDPWYWIVLENTAVKEEGDKGDCKEGEEEKGEEEDEDAEMNSPLLRNIRENQKQQCNTNLLGKLILGKIGKGSECGSNVVDNLVSEDYVRHIEEMNADLLDKIQQQTEQIQRQMERINQLETSAVTHSSNGYKMAINELSNNPKFVGWV
jgi:hypothetical protein